MMKSALRCFGMSVVLSALSVTALAEAPDIRPGLWEHTVDMTSKSGRIDQAMEQQKKMMESMPPEQRKMMEAMMSERGIKMDLGQRSIQSCLTQEQIDNLHIAKVEEGCTQTTKKTAKNRYSISLSCPNDNMKGEGEYIIANEKSFSGSMVMDVNMHGQSDTITSKMKGKWISAECGDLGR